MLNFNTSTVSAIQEHEFDSNLAVAELRCTEINRLPADLLNADIQNSHWRIRVIKLYDQWLFERNVVSTYGFFAMIPKPYGGHGNAIH